MGTKRARYGSEWPIRYCRDGLAGTLLMCLEFGAGFGVFAQHLYDCFVVAAAMSCGVFTTWFDEWEGVRDLTAVWRRLYKAQLPTLQKT